MKYIDADKLIAEIEKRQEHLEDHNFHSMVSEYDWLLTIVQSLQQEQPLTIEKVVEQCKKFGGNPEVIQPEPSSWTKIDNSRKNVVFPFNAKVKDSDKVVTIIDGQLNFNGKQWIRFVSNRDDGFKVYCPEDLLVEQEQSDGGSSEKPNNHAEWSEEDEKFFKTALWHISYSVSNGKTTDDHCDTTHWLKGVKERLKILCPSWKPSEEQMKTLKCLPELLRNFKLDSSARMLEVLYEQLKEL